MSKAWCYFLLLMVIFIGCSQQEGNFRKIKKGKFQASLVETGELQAVNSRIIVMPWLGWKYGQPILGKLVDEGTVVKKDDFVAQVEPSGIYKFLKEKQSELEMAKADLRNLEVRHSARLKELEGEMASTRSALELTIIQAEKVRFEPEKKRRKSELEQQRSQIAFDKVKQKLAMTLVSQKNELAIQKLKVFTLDNEIRDADRALKKASLLAPINGLVEHKENRRTRQKVRAGDQLWPGSPIAGIPDLSRMKVLATVNETDIKKIQLGHKVIVRMDAFPDIPFNGQIAEIAKLCRKKDQESPIKVFDLTIFLEKSDPILKPGMTVSCEILTAELKNALYVENDCIVTEDSHPYLYLKTKGGLEKRRIKIGARNNNFTVIDGDLKPGQQVARRDLVGEK